MRRCRLDDTNPRDHLAERLATGSERHQIAAVLHQEKRKERRLRQDAEIVNRQTAQSAS